MLHVGGDEGAGVFQSGSSSEYGAKGRYRREISGAVSKRRWKAAAGGIFDLVYAFESCAEADRRVGWFVAGDFDDSQSDGRGLFAAWAIALELQRASGEF